MRTSDLLIDAIKIDFLPNYSVLNDYFGNNL